jgi:hypothetical protein
LINYNEQAIPAIPMPGQLYQQQYCLLEMSKLFEPLEIGSARLGHRVAMAPLTRYRCDNDWMPTAMIKSERVLSFLDS